MSNPIEVGVTEEIEKRNWSDRHEAKNMERKVNAYPSHIWIKSNQLPSHKKPGRDCLGKQNLQ